MKIASILLAALMAVVFALVQGVTVEESAEACDWLLTTSCIDKDQVDILFHYCNMTVYFGGDKALAETTPYTMDEVCPPSGRRNLRTN